MKTYQLKPSTIVQPAMLQKLPSLLRRLTALEKLESDGPPRPSVCIGADLDKAGACLAVMVGAEGVCAGGTFTRAEIVSLVEELAARGWRVALAQLVAGRVVHGDPKSGRVVREPTLEEQQRRYLTRHRVQLVSARGRIEAQGRGLLYDMGLEAVPECWWGMKTWPRLLGVRFAFENACGANAQRPTPNAQRPTPNFQWRRTEPFSPAPSLRSWSLRH